MHTCQDIGPRLTLLVDGLLTLEEERDVRMHLRGCAACRHLLADLEQLRTAARQLGPIDPPAHVWLEVAGQIRQTHAADAAPISRVPRQPIWQWLGLAAALVLITIGLYVYERIQIAEPSAVADNAAPTGSVEAVANELNIAAAHYEKAIAELEAMTKNSDTPVDAAVATVVRQNIGAIDSAIAESRAALASNPDSEPARNSLFDALRRKIDVLQTTVSLINEMRAGDQEGAQRAAQSLGKKS